MLVLQVKNKSQRPEVLFDTSQNIFELKEKYKGYNTSTSPTSIVQLEALLVVSVSSSFLKDKQAKPEIL